MAGAAGIRSGEKEPASAVIAMATARTGAQIPQTFTSVPNPLYNTIYAQTETRITAATLPPQSCLIPASIMIYAEYANKPQQIVIKLPIAFPPTAIFKACGSCMFPRITVRSALAPQNAISAHAAKSPINPG